MHHIQLPPTTELHANDHNISLHPHSVDLKNDILRNQYVPLADDHRLRIDPNNIARADHEQLLFPALPKERQRLLTGPLPQILSWSLGFFGLGLDEVAVGTTAALVRDRHVEIFLSPRLDTQTIVYFFRVG
jgi:hypothetical protein